MLNMLGRLMWVAIGALGVKAWEAAEDDRRKGGAASGTASGTAKRPRSRKRSSGT